MNAAEKRPGEAYEGEERQSQEGWLRRTDSNNKLLIGILFAILGNLGIGVAETAQTQPADVREEVKKAQAQVEENNRTLERIDRLLGARDQNGVPLIYVPREFLRTQERILDTLEDIRDGIKDAERRGGG